MFNSKEIDCEICKAKTNKKKICTFDYSRQGRIKQGETLKICQKCCLNKLVEGIKQNVNKAIIIQPENEFNTYTFYSFNDLLDGKKQDKFIDDLKSFLPEEHKKCNYCNNIAYYTWCSLGIIYDDPYSMEVNLDEKIKSIYVCKDCLIELLKKRVEDQNIQFRYVYPIVDEVGYYTPWDV